MSQTNVTPGPERSPSTQLYRLDEACVRFEAAWQREERPCLEDYLKETAEEHRPAWLRELLPLELEYRRMQGESPDVADYLPRFPGHERMIRDIFNEPKTADTDDGEKMESFPFVPEATATDADRFPTPVVPGYEILREVGRGGMAVVLKARQLGFNRIVALKMIRTGALADPQERARFRTEAEAAARLQHPNIVQVFDFGETNGMPYLGIRRFLAAQAARFAQFFRVLTIS
jgi:hypothetical protein